MANDLPRADLLAAKRAMRKGDARFALTFLSSALTVSADPAEGLTLEQLQQVCVMVAGEIDNIVRLATSKKE